MGEGVAFVRKLFFYLTILLFSSSLYAANQCSFRGNLNFTIEATVIGKPTAQEIYVTNNGGKKTDVLWYTGSASDDGLNYVFKEEQLINGSRYVIRIINDADNALLKYYKKPIGGSWSGPEVYYGYIHQGNIHILSDIDDVNFSCQLGITEPEVPPAPIDLCKYFPEPAQSWKSGSSLNIQNLNSVITGWSEEYVGTYLSDGQLKTSYDSFSYQAGLPGACEVGSCVGGAPKVDVPQPINVSFDSNIDLSIDAWNYTSNCTLARNCQFSESGGTVFVDIVGPLRSLSVQEYSSSNKHFVINFKPVNNDSGPVIQSYSSGGSVETIFHSGNYILGSVSFNGGTLKVYSDVVLNLVTSLTQSNAVDTIDVGGKKDLIIYGPSAYLSFDTPNVDFYAQILADRVTFSNPVTIRGAITANTLTMSTQNINIIGEGACLTEQPEEDYTLVLSPATDIALVCEVLSPTLTVMSDGAVATDFNGTATVNVNGVETSVSITNGTATIDLSSNGESKTISVNASLDGYSDVNSVSGSYQFVPFKFAVEDQYVIANKQQLTTVSALACSRGEQVDVGYNGQPTVSSSWQQPSNGSGELSFSPVLQGGISTEASRGLTLEDSGEMVVTLTDESFDCSDLDDCPIDGNGKLTGEFTVYSRPWIFAICSTSDTNLDSATGNSDGGNGFIPAGETFSAQVIPLKYQSNLAGEVATDSDWCRPSNITTNFFLVHSFGNKIKLSSEVASPANANSTALLASGDDLSIDRQNNDSEYLFTNLYWDEVGSLKVMVATESYDATCSSVSGLQAWYECTQRGYREVGRFYPAYFEVTQSDWSVSEQNNISYLSQPYDLAEFTVLPRTSKGSSVRNYDKFAGGLRATLNILQDEDIGSDRLALSVSDDNNWQYDTTKFESNWHLADLSAVFYRDVTLNSSGKHVSEVDGPFNIPTEALIGDELSTSTRFGFVVQGGVDPVETRGQVLTSCLNESSEVNTEGELSSCNLLFPTQPPSRYGRMKLFDVGGTSTISSIRVPLQIEYWNGTQFVVNTDDSNSVFSTDGNKTCQQVLWRELIDGAAIVQEASLAGAAGEKTVSEGVSSLVTAEPATTDVGYIRQQVRFWLRLDNDNTVSQQGCSSALVSKAQPWLRYNWWKNQDGSINEDEDPSAVVTFGIHRGNDRIIFRGESNLTGQ